MATLQVNYSISVTKEEFDALVTGLGNMSINGWMAAGCSREQAEIFSKMYNDLSDQIEKSCGKEND